MVRERNGDVAVDAIRAATAASDAARLRAGLRDRLCAGRPGAPQEYRVAVRTTCVAQRGEAKRAAVDATKGRRAARAKKAGAVPSAAANKAEVRILEKEIAAAYPNKKKAYDVMVDGGIPHMSHLVMIKMMDPRVRLLTPDPLARYDKEVELLRKTADAAASRPYFDVRDVPRHTILAATLAHVSALS